MKVSSPMVMEPPFLLPKSISFPSIKKAGVPVMASMRLPMPISNLIFLSTSLEAMSELNFSRSPLSPATVSKYLSKRAVRSELEA